MLLPTMSLAAPIASTSKSDSNVSNPNPVSLSKRLEDQRQSLLDQRDILDRLADGEGIATHKWDGVVNSVSCAINLCWGPSFRIIIGIVGIYQRMRAMLTSGRCNSESLATIFL